MKSKLALQEQKDTALSEAVLSTSRVEQLCEQVEGMILTGAIPLGGKLNELALAQELGVSRGLLREAVRLLEKSGLVRIELNRGVFVRELDIKGVLDLFDVRAGLARVAAQLAAQRASDDDIRKLCEILLEMESAMKHIAFQDYFALNTKFHTTIFDLACNERLSNLEDMMSTELSLYRRQNLLQTQQLKTSHAEHTKIVEAITRRDAAKSGAAFEKHIKSGRQRFLEQISRS